MGGDERRQRPRRARWEQRNCANCNLVFCATASQRAGGFCSKECELSFGLREAPQDIDHLVDVRGCAPASHESVSMCSWPSLASPPSPSGAGNWSPRGHKAAGFRPFLPERLR